MTKTNQENHDGRTSRREFAKTVAAALVAVPVAAAVANAGAQTTAPKEPKAPPNPQPTPATPVPSPVVSAYAEVAHARFGEQLTPEELERVKRDLEGNVRTADRLRSFKLKNSDEPDFVFSA